MTVLSITRLRLHGISQLPAFFADNQKAIRQIVTSTGFVTGKVLVEPSLAMWTETMWDNENDLRQFYLHGIHHELMRRLSDYACESAVMHLPYDADILPGWTWAHRTLVSGGRFSKALKHPSDDHRHGVIKPPKLTVFTRLLKARQLASH